MQALHLYNNNNIHSNTIHTIHNSIYSNKYTLYTTAYTLTNTHYTQQRTLLLKQHAYISTLLIDKGYGNQHLHRTIQINNYDNTHFNL